MSTTETTPVVASTPQAEVQPEPTATNVAANLSSEKTKRPQQSTAATLRGFQTRRLHEYLGQAAGGTTEGDSLEN